MGCANSSSINTSESHPGAKKVRIKAFSHKNNVNPDQITEQINVTSTKLNESQMNFAISKLAEHPFFGTLSKQQLKAIAEEMVLAKPNEENGYIFKQGDMGTCFFLVYSGSVDTEINNKYVRTLNKGDTFGELALLLRSPRTASILCKTKNCQFLVVKPLIYKKTLKKMRTEEQHKNLQAIQKVPLFSCLTNKQKHALSSTIKIMIFNPGEIIFRTGDDAQALYITSEGNVKIEITGKKDIDLHSGEIFGESSIQENMKRSGTARAVIKTVCSMISRKDIQATLGSSINNLLFYNSKKWALMRSSVFKNLTPPELNRAIISFEAFFVKDKAVIDNITYQGFIICLQGEINKTGEGKIFNEEGWLKKNYKCQGKLTKNGDGHCSFLSFTKAQQLFDDLGNQKKLKKHHGRSKIDKTKFSLSNFIYLKKLGEGQFGQVFLVKNIQFGVNLYAVKCLSKDYIAKEELQENVIQQKKILQKIVFPYIVGYVKAFHDKKFIYLMMEYIHGKEMFDVIRQMKSMSTDMIKYCFGCLLISIQYLHANNIVYRDLKPQNSVIDSQGKAFLIDLGTAKQLNSDNFFKTFTIIGTPHYMAPEVFEGNGYSFQVDIWSLGCILYEFLCFHLPFGENTESDPYSVYTSIKKTNLTFPKFLKDQKARKLISLLLNKDPRRRGEATFEKIKKCDFFKGFNWTSLIEEEMKGPYIPKQFRNNPLEQLQKMEGKDFLKHLYNNNKHYEIQEWNSTF